MPRPTVLERAVELARHGPQSDVNGIRSQLKLEGFEGVEAHLASRSLAGQLRNICNPRTSQL